MSGGEKTRFKLAEAFSEDRKLLVLDEPTNNLDIEGIELLKKSLEEFNGTLIMVSHDRYILNSICTKIVEVEDGKVSVFSGNYDSYIEQKSTLLKSQESEYNEYLSEKKRIEGMISETKNKSKNIRTTPKRMGNSEARLHKMGGQKQKAKIDNTMRNMQKRLEKLEVKVKPKEAEIINLSMEESSKLHSKIVISGKKISKSYGKKIIFKNAEFEIYSGSKVALVGANGTGKSTLLDMIVNYDSTISISREAKIGYFNQSMEILDLEKSIIENVILDSIYDEKTARNMLARLLFKGDDVNKKAKDISGGERVKVSFAKIVLGESNILILDEPTNHLDIESIRVLEEALRSYGGTLIFTSHDREFIDNIADNIIMVENHKLKSFKGNYSEMIEREKDKGKGDVLQKISKLENRLSVVIGKLSMPSKGDSIEKLDREYYELMKEIKEQKKNI